MSEQPVDWVENGLRFVAVLIAAGGLFGFGCHAGRSMHCGGGGSGNYEYRIADGYRIVCQSLVDVEAQP